MSFKPEDRRKLKWFLIRRGRMVAKNVNECWLDTNFHKGYIDNELHFAGTKLRGIYERTIPKTIISYTTDRIDSGGNWNDNNIGRLNALDKLKVITLELGRADYQLTILHYNSVREFYLMKLILNLMEIIVMVLSALMEQGNLLF